MKSSILWRILIITLGVGIMIKGIQRIPYNSYLGLQITGLGSFLIIIGFLFLITVNTSNQTMKEEA